MSGTGTFNKAGARAPAKTMQDRINELKAKRPTPKVERHLTPGGHTHTQVVRQQVTLHEQRIRMMTTQRTQAKTKIERGFSKAKVRGQARSAFDRSR